MPEQTRFVTDTGLTPLHAHSHRLHRHQRPTEPGSHFGAPRGGEHLLYVMQSDHLCALAVQLSDRLLLTAPAVAKDYGGYAHEWLWRESGL